MSKPVTDQIERALFVQAEMNYLTGATALVKAEIALTQQAMYHKPAFNRNWAWDYRTEARIRGGQIPAKQYDWDDTPELRRDAETDEPIKHRDASSFTTLTALELDEIKPLPTVAGRIAGPSKTLRLKVTA